MQRASVPDDFTMPLTASVDTAHVREHIAAGHDAGENVAKALEQEAEALGDDVALEGHGEETR